MVDDFSPFEFRRNDDELVLTFNREDLRSAVAAMDEPSRQTFFQSLLNQVREQLEAMIQADLPSARFRAELDDLD